MSLCWSCDRDAGSAAFCANCGAIAPARADEDAFEVLGLPARFDIDLGVAEGQFRERSRQFHPDRFVKADPRARKASLGRSVQLNEAWRTLRDPERRAEYLLKRHGYDVTGETGPTAPAPPDAGAAAVGSAGEAGEAGGVAGGERVRLPVPTALLGEILELREELGDARDAGDPARLRSVAAKVRDLVEGARGEVRAGFERALASPGPDPASSGEALKAVAHAVMAIRYYRRLLDEIPEGLGAAQL